MRKISLSLMIILWINWLNAQDLYVTSKGDTIRVNDTLIVGPGIDANGAYRYIDAGLIGLSPEFIGHKMVVKAIEKKGSEKRGFTYFLKIHPGVGIVNYRARMDYAITSGELIIENKLYNERQVIEKN